MREILFRAKDDYGRWAFGSYAHSETHFPNDDKDFIIPRKVIGHSDFSQIPIDIETLGQYTGIHDKNGKKIFEGDIVKQHFERHIENPIVYDDFRGYVVGVVSITGRGTFIKPSYGELYIDEEKEDDYKPQRKRLISYRAEVIGNVYDNPELLKEVKEDEAD